MDTKLQNALVALGTIVVTALAQHFTAVVPVEKAREANAVVNYACQDQLKTVITLLATCEADE